MAQSGVSSHLAPLYQYIHQMCWVNCHYDFFMLTAPQTLFIYLFQFCVFLFFIF